MQLDYSADYYRQLMGGSGKSAKAIVPVVMDLIQPKSVVDLGCGTGAWLAEFKRAGVKDVLGIDGPHLGEVPLEMDQRDFLAADLTQPLRLHGYFDLAMSLEVAEHLEEAQADQFVETLTKLAPVVLFSAAIPHQGGEHHVNEQWPGYWAERFEAHEFLALDPFRRLLWERSDVDWWYSQNLVLYVHQEHVSRFPWIMGTNERGVPTFVHPQNYLNQTWQNRVLRVSVDIGTMTRPGDTIILADEDRFGRLYLPGRVIRPIIERNGIYFGPPSDDQAAISELLRLRDQGADYLAVGWPAFWWLKHYKRFAAFLKEQFIESLRNEHVVIYQLGK
jgi:SAM-dependent methyltransferase